MLKRCPFCGRNPEPIVKTIYEGYNFLHRCEVVGVISIEFSSKERIELAWNTRRSTPSRKRA